DAGQIATCTLTTGSMQLATTGWAQASSVITVTFTSASNLGVDDITYRGGDGGGTPPPGQATTVDFDNPAPPGSSSSLLEGVFQGVDFGTGQGRWESAYDADSTNHIVFHSASGTSRS